MLVRSLKILFVAFFLGLASVSFLETTQAASLTFTPSSTAFKQGCSAKIDIVVDTQGVSTNAVDAVIFFNSSEVQIIDQIPSIPGTQIKPGNVYEVYAGNMVDESQGKILLTAFSVTGTFNGSGLLGSIYFTSKPGVTQTSFQFQFTPGQSTDSNVANTNGNDVLSSVNSGAYTFQTGPCVADTQAPSVSQVSPANNSIGVPLNTNVSLHISDNQSGVNLNTVEIQIHDVVYLPTSPEVNLTGLPLDYTFTINPLVDFPEDTEIVMVVKATDVDGNVMSPKVFSFNKPVPPPPPPAEPVCGNGMVEEGEACEPPGTFGCSETCQIDVLQCLSVDPQLLEQLALQSQESGQLDSSQIGSISDLETLQRIVHERIIREQEFLAGGVSSNEVIRTVTRSTKKIFQSVGCTENCEKILFGEQSQRWYLPFMFLLLFIILLVFVTYKISRKLSERSDRAMQMEEKGRKRKK